MQLGSDFALGAGGLTGNNGTLDLAGFSPTLLSLSGSGCVITNSSANSSTLTVSQSATTDFGGTMQDGSGTLALVLDGPGELILSGRDTYGGGTIVTAGTLAVTTASALPEGGSLTVGAGAAFIFGSSVAASPIANATAAVAVPEPSAPALSVAGAIGLAGWAWRRRRSLSKMEFSRVAVAGETVL